MDITFIFCKDSTEQLAYLGWILVWFEAISSLRINLTKSVILPIGRVVSGDDLVAELDCQLGSIPSEFLGLPLRSKLHSTVV